MNYTKGMDIVNDILAISDEKEQRILMTTIMTCWLLTKSVEERTKILDAVNKQAFLKEFELIVAECCKCKKTKYFFTKESVKNGTNTCIKCRKK